MCRTIFWFVPSLTAPPPLSDSLHFCFRVTHTPAPSFPPLASPSFCSPFQLFMHTPREWLGGKAHTHLRAGIFSLHGTQGLAVVPCLALGLNALSLIFSLLQLDLCPTQRNAIMSKCADVHEVSRAKQKVCSHYLLVETELEEMFRKLISPIT